jgi:hypothetical protein
MGRGAGVAIAALACMLASPAGSRKASGQTDPATGKGGETAGTKYALDSMDGVEVQSVKENGATDNNSKGQAVTYRGRRAVRIENIEGAMAAKISAGAQSIGILKSSDFKDGTIELEIAGLPREGAPADVRGFVGIAFRVQEHGAKFECIYLRMTNGRADDQLRRNHSAQYESQPEYSWKRLRTENPGLYESYVDLDAGAWTKVKIEVAGTTAKLYVNGAAQPCLVVHDLKLGESRGQIALWTGSDSDGYFSNLVVK